MPVDPLVNDGSVGASLNFMSLLNISPDGPPMPAACSGESIMPVDPLVNDGSVGASLLLGRDSMSISSTRDGVFWGEESENFVGDTVASLRRLMTFTARSLRSLLCVVLSWKGEFAIFCISSSTPGCLRAACASCSTSAGSLYFMSATALFLVLNIEYSHD